MIAAIVRDDFPVPPADQMQVLIEAQTKPGSWKAERRPRNRLQVQHIAIKGDAFFEVGDVQSNVIELSEAHGRRDLGFSF
jgi:hypothetical protein